MCKIQRTFERCWKRKIGKRKPWFANLTRLRGPKFQNRPKVCQPGWTLEKKKNESQRERKAIKTNAKEEKRIACSGFNCSSVWTNARPECFRNFGIVSLLCSPPPLFRSRGSRRRRRRKSRGTRRRRGRRRGEEEGSWRKEREKRVHLGSMKTCTSWRSTRAKCSWFYVCVRRLGVCVRVARREGRLEAALPRSPSMKWGARCSYTPTHAGVGGVRKGPSLGPPLTSTFLEPTCPRTYENPPGLIW